MAQDNIRSITEGGGRIFPCLRSQGYRWKERTDGFTAKVMTCNIAVSHLPVLVNSFLLTLSLSLLLDIFLIMPDAQICSFFSLHMLLLHCGLG